MKSVILRSVVVSCVLSITFFLVINIMFTEMYVPKDSYDHEKAATLSIEEQLDYNDVHMEKISGLRVIPHLFERHILKYKLQYVAVYFISILLGCLWIIKWESKKKYVVNGDIGNTLF